MSFNNKIIIVLSITIFLLLFLLFLFIICIKNQIFESFIINLITGALVSLFITYMQYKKEKIDIFCHYNDIIIKYYYLLDDILEVLKDSSKSYMTKINIIDSYLSNYIRNNKFKEKNIQINLILDNIANKYTKKIYSKLYAYADGVELAKYYIDFKKNKPNNIDDLICICELQKNNIDEGMNILSIVFEIGYQWENIKKSNEMMKIYF